MSGANSNINLGTIGSTAGIPTLNAADIPANIRNGDSRAMQAYSEGLAFENMLVNELTQQLSKTMSGGDSSSPDPSGGSSSGSAGGGMLSGLSAYASLIPQALSSSIMSGGGLGMAEKFAQELDPSLLAQSANGQAANPQALTQGAASQPGPPTGGARRAGL
jgi:hypothetical protein